MNNHDRDVDMNRYPRAGVRSAHPGFAQEHLGVQPAVEAQQLAASQALAAAMPYNIDKGQEFGRDNALAPTRGTSTSSDLPTASASTLSEINASPKTAAIPSGRPRGGYLKPGSG